MAILQPLRNQLNSHTDARGAVMFLRKLSFYAMLATMLTFAAAEEVNRHVKEFDVPEMDTWANDLSLPASFRAESEMPPADFLPVQSRDPRDLGPGKLLVASRKLADPNFAETVILLVHCDTEGVLGLMLNRRTELPISRVFAPLKAAKDLSDPVYWGGPVETATVFALLGSTDKLERAEHVFGGVYWISTKTALEKAISSRPDPGVFHVYLGYAGWTTDQLRNEVQLGGWFIFQADNQTVFNANPDSLWRQMIKKTELRMAGCPLEHFLFVSPSRFQVSRPIEISYNGVTDTLWGSLSG
jgi:putative transcriptional regulator